MRTASLFRRGCLALLAFPAVTAFSNAAASGFDTWAEDFTLAWLRDDPLWATVSQYLPKEEQTRVDRELYAVDFQFNTPLETARRERRAARAREGLAELEKWKTQSLTPIQRTSVLYLEFMLKDSLRTAEIVQYRPVFEQFNGLQLSTVQFLTQMHPLRDAADVENYLARLERLAPVLDVGIAEATTRAERGVVPPRFILDRTIEAIDRFLEPSPGENLVVAALRDRTASLKNLFPAQREEALARAEQICAATVRPSFHRVRDLLVAQREGATDDAGLCRLPEGQAAYAIALASNTTTTFSADEVHEIGLRQVALIEAEMDGILRELGYREGSVKQRVEALEASLHPPTGTDIAPVLLGEYQNLVRDAEKRAAFLFDLRPKAPVEVRRVPAFSEKNSSAYYNLPAPDGSMPGVFYVPLAGPNYDILSMRTTTYHETIPGHHFQIALQQESKELPRFRALFAFGGTSAFAEGWALYAERLAAEYGWYEGDPKGRLGYLSDQLFRARRLVVDTGLHTRRWTRQQAIDYGISASEVERYVVIPGQACSYMIGQLKILELRKRAKQRLGAKFSIKEFHNVILRTADVPLDVLEQVVDAWIQAQV